MSEGNVYSVLVLYPQDATGLPAIELLYLPEADLPWQVEELTLDGTVSSRQKFLDQGNAIQAMGHLVSTCWPTQFRTEP